MTTEDLAEMARELNGRSESYALVTVVRAVAPSSAYPGAQAIILADGKLHGWIGGGCARDLVISAAKAAIEKGEPKLVRISNDKIYAEEDIEHYRMSCASNGSIELFIQPNNLSNALCVLGSTPAADEARFLAQRLRIRLTELPGDAPERLIQGRGRHLKGFEAVIRFRETTLDYELVLEGPGAPLYVEITQINNEFGERTFSQKELYQQAGMSRTSAFRICQRLAAAGVLTRVRYGEYRLDPDVLRQIGGRA